MDSWVYFGDGNAAMIVEAKDVIDPSGLKKVRFVLRPSRRIEAMYKISDEQDSTGMILKEYNHSEVIFLVRGAVQTVCWVVTDFNGGPTPVSRRDEDLRKTIEDNERLLMSLEAAKNRAYEELMEERTQQLEAMRKKVDLVKMAASAKGRSAIDEGFNMDPNSAGE